MFESISYPTISRCPALCIIRALCSSVVILLIHSAVCSRS